VTVAIDTVVGPAARTAVWATGTERLTYLDAVLSQRLRDAPVGTATSALELGPHGEPTGVLDLAILDERVLILLPDALADDVFSRLAGRTFMSDAAFAQAEEMAVLRVRGTDAHAVAAAAALPTAPGVAVEGPDHIRLGFGHGVDIVATPSALATIEASLCAAGATSVDAVGVDNIEVITGVPRAPEEITRGRLPEEIGILATHVHLTKGCYPGQEAVARMWMLGRPRRRLAVLELGDEVATPGTYGEGRSGVVVTRVAQTPAGPVGLGFVAADAVPGDEPVPGAIVRSIVGADTPVPGHDPAMTRRRDR
jgi:folate-binding protein YgfZ